MPQHLPADSQPQAIPPILPPQPEKLIQPAAPAQSQSPSPLHDEFAHITQRMYTQNLALSQTNRTLSILRAIDLLILEASRDIPRLSSDIAKSITDASPYSMVAILSLARFNDKFITLNGLSFSNLISQNTAAISTHAQLKGLCLSLDGTWLASPQRNLMVNLENDDAAQKLQKIGFGEAISKLLERLHYDSNIRSLYLTKLGASNNTNGVMIIGMEESIPKIDDIELIERLSQPAGIALDNRLLYEENQRFVAQLQKTNDHLKELDQAKDEFISLVSHQLRTPLTSIKGLLSLVLDGDVGDISEQQRGMLQQAFDSSQRMVYVIADLLNASRLQSGKFTILNRVTFLPDVIETELDQLAASAKGRNIALNFTKPMNFPKLMLDETKIRQVIMNFLDNALYYTPNGGHIDVRLQATDKVVECTVTDSGLGVPKVDQPNLFTKFYRADNAKKMRPEGTGLGLYMAKKVVVAQGGAIVFSSVEGKGSTFGFIFPMDKVVVTPESEKAANLNTQSVDSSLI